MAFNRFHEHQALPSCSGCWLWELAVCFMLGRGLAELTSVTDLFVFCGSAPLACEMSSSAGFPISGWQPSNHLGQSRCSQRVPGPWEPRHMRSLLEWNILCFAQWSSKHPAVWAPGCGAFVGRTPAATVLIPFPLAALCMAVPALLPFVVRNRGNCFISYSNAAFSAPGEACIA